LRAFAELCLGITFLVEFVSAIMKKDLQKTKGDRILMQIERFCIAIFFIAFPFRVMHWPGAGLMYVISLLLLVIVLVIRMLNLFFKGGYSKNQKTLFLISYLLAITSSTIFIFNLISQDPVIFFVFLALTFSFICCSVILLFLVRLFTFLLKRDKISSQKLISDLFFSTTIILCLGILFKTMHWPLGNIFALVGLISFVVTLSISVIQKTNTENGTINLFSSLTSKFKYNRFIFIYFGIWSIYISLALFKIAPKFHSNQFPYEFEKLLEADESDKADKIMENYDALIQQIDSKNEAEQ
jgi:hypothetical protein